MTPPLISSFPIPGRMFLLDLGLIENIKRKLVLFVSSLLHPLIYKCIFSEFDEILRQSPLERDTGTVRYYANLCGEWCHIMSSHLEKNLSRYGKSFLFLNVYFGTGLKINTLVKSSGMRSVLPTY
ncbi:MAG: hypothetical protein OMM_11641 [Candidatus Magnetoglobus multicellularis str. Araruama]|uniref:Uncharacterized protein n=1 Tax=Candidatus Magnetoglobus multicellularis str. Araruama TaxID=890399 RepID=A0A1V1NXU5_9BACT|nr:MAG: hypothetical protein OMM_11641 [Candidatus Magnetoglobus multicellularis str. Araruama]